MPKQTQSFVRRLARQLPPLRRLIEQRDALLREREYLLNQLANARAHSVRNPIPHHSSRPPFSLCEVANPARYDDPEWLELHYDLERYALDKHCFQNCSGHIYRKGWEWTQCIFGLRKLGMIQPDATAVGVGAGRECVIYYLADHIRHVTATDLYDEVGWSSSGGREADASLLKDSQACCPSSVDFSKVTFGTENGVQLTYKPNTFDFAWSLSSIEHFGGHEAAAQAVREMGRVIKPGGVVAIATEVLLLEEYTHPEYFTPSEIRSWIVEASPDLELVQDIDFDTLPVEYMIDSIPLWSGVDRRRRHVVMNSGDVQWTSIMVFLRKKGG